MVGALVGRTGAVRPLEALGMNPLQEAIGKLDEAIAELERAEARGR
jgi:hypothetical protein